MPLIPTRILQVNAFNRPPAIISAGEDLVILCSPLVQLHLTIVDDGRTHTIEWVQIDGTIVEIFDANTADPWFVNPNTGDLAFRVYVDRGTYYEASDEIRIFRQPTSIGAMGDYKGGWFWNPSSATHPQAGLVVDARVVPAYYLNNDGTGNENMFAGRTPSYALEWTIPSTISAPHLSPWYATDTKYEFQGAYVQMYDTNLQQWVRLEYVPREYDYFNFPFSDGRPYRLEAVWKYTYTGSQLRQSSKLIFVTPQATTTSWGVHRNQISAPNDYVAHANSGGAMGDYFSSSLFNFSRTALVPSRKTYIVTVNEAIGALNISANLSTSNFRVGGKKVAYDDSGSIGTSSFSGLPLGLSIFRAAGIIIG